jgi:ferredoxin
MGGATNFMVKYKVEVDLKTCVSTGACYASDRSHFQSGKNQQSNVIGGQTDESKSSNLIDDNQLADAQEAAKNCPVSAITVTEQ